MLFNEIETGLIEEKIIIFDSQSGEIDYLSPAVAQKVGLNEAEYSKRKIFDLVDATFIEPVLSSEEEGVSFDILAEIKIKDGERHKVKLVAKRICSGRVILIFDDSYEKFKMFQRISDQISDWLVVTDVDGVVVFVNKEVEKVTGFKKEEIIGQKPSLWKSGNYDELYYKQMWDTILAGEAFRSIIENKRKDGEFFYSDQTISPLKDIGGKIVFFVSTGKDITSKKIFEQRISHVQYHDQLTELPNRLLFNKTLELAMDSSNSQIKEMICVFIIDLNDFVLINENYGTDKGDFILKQISKRLSTYKKGRNSVARLGGDKFAYALFDPKTNDDVAIAANDIINLISQEFNIHDQDLVLSSNIGISIYPNDGEEVSRLITKAEVALDRAKKEGRNRFEFYSENMNVTSTANIFLEQGLRKAVNNGEFIVYYQPYFDINTKELSGMEALLRWNSTELGMVPPGKFIPILERTGMIKEVGMNIIRDVAAKLNEWRDAGYKLPTVSINVSPVQVREESMLEMIYSIIAGYSLSHELFTFEITESTFMEDLDFTNKFLSKMKQLGFSISIDDFGTGYSSLGYLKRFPVDNLKIDITFVREITSNYDDKAIVNAIISMAKSLNLKTIAEGVETQEQLDILRELDCNFVQGYFWARPMPADDIEKGFLKPVSFE